MYAAAWPRCTAIKHVKARKQNTVQTIVSLTHSSTRFPSMQWDSHLGKRHTASMWIHASLLNWGPFEGAISIPYRTVKEWLCLQSFSAIIYEKRISLPSGKGSADSITKCSMKILAGPFEGARERNSGVTIFRIKAGILEISIIL